MQCRPSLEWNDPACWTEASLGAVAAATDTGAERQPFQSAAGAILTTPKRVEAGSPGPSEGRAPARGFHPPTRIPSVPAPGRITSCFRTVRPARDQSADHLP